MWPISGTTWHLSGNAKLNHEKLVPSYRSEMGSSRTKSDLP
jgi:hypothetical protein